MTLTASRLANAFLRLPLQRKLVAIVVGTSSVSLLLAAGAFASYDRVVSRAKMANDLGLLAESTALISEAAVIFDDPVTAEQILATLRAQPHIVYATISDTDGELFASYGDDSEAPEEILPDGSYFSSDFLRVFHTITRDEEVLGVIHLQSDLVELNQRLLRFGLFVTLILMVALTATTLVTLRLQKLISGPILRLASVTNSVRKNRDYSVRATREAGEGELSQLVDGFNEMLTEIQLRDAEVTSAKKEAEQATRTKSQFLTNMSHELRTPLNAIIGYAEILAETAEEEGAVLHAAALKDQIVADLARIHGSGMHLLLLINDVLDLAKIEAGKLELMPEYFNISTLLDDVVGTVAPLLAKNQNEITVRKSDDLGTINADIRHVRQILLNLLSNACKFTAEGTVHLNADHVDHDAGALLRIQVTDTGIGMTEEELGKLFHAFTQADASTARDYGGTGLGLALSRELAIAMGGDLTAVSKQGVGSTFTLNLPLGLVERANTP